MKRIYVGIIVGMIATQCTSLQANESKHHTIGVNLGFGETVQNKILLNMIYEEFNKKIRYDINQDEEKKKSVCFSLDNKKIYTSTSWKPSISIWDGISMLVNENKFNSKASLTEFTNRIRKLYK